MNDLLVDLFPIPITQITLMEKDNGILLSTSKKSRWIFMDRDSYHVLVEVFESMCFSKNFNENWDLSKHLFKSDFGNVILFFLNLDIFGSK